MKKIIYLLGIWSIVFTGLSCDPDNIEINFEDIEKNTIYDYIKDHQEQFSSFLQIMEKGGLDKTLTAYNPNGDGYTLFLPTNEAIQSFLDNNGTYSTLEELINAEDYLWYFCRYHVVNKGINSNDFPFGAFSEYTLTDDYLAVSFINETDTSYYKINNTAPVIQPNIELSNGYIHIISAVLTPVTLTSYDWLTANPGYSIFKEAVDATGFNELLDVNTKTDESVLPFTLLLEHDSIYNKRGIHSFAELAGIVSPEQTDYTNVFNPMYNYVGYHMLTAHMFLDDFEQEGASTNYATYSDIPLHVYGLGIDIMINKGKQMFDTIIHSVGDTTFIDYVGINYDASNVITQSGVIHLINQVLTQQVPTRALQTFELYERPLFDEFAEEPGTYLIEDSTLLTVIRYSGAELSYVKLSESEAPNGLWSEDYIFIEGDFKVSLNTPKLVQGGYTLYLQADFYNSLNAVINVYVDGKPIGGSINLSNDPDVDGTANDPFGSKELGVINFTKYESHTITIESLIPGAFSWDYIQFEPL